MESLFNQCSFARCGVGGIFSNKNKTGKDSIPLLGDIPWFGQLFRHDGKENERRELVVFITPRLVSTE